MGVRRRMTLTATVAAGLLSLALTGSVAAADESVSIAGLAFSPSTVTISEGDSVTWTNQDQVPHTATGDSFDTEQLDAGQSSTITFSTAGTYAYICSIHPTMNGTVVVQAVATAPPPTEAPTAAPTDAPGPTDAATAAPTTGGGGAGGTTTQPPTDMPEPSADASSTPTTAIALLLAISGIAMLAGTYLFERRARRP